jgi:hypothetical protein
MKKPSKNGWNDFPLFPVTRIDRSRGGTISGTTRKLPHCRKRSRWNARPQKKSPCFLLGCRSVPEYLLRGEAGTIPRENAPTTTATRHGLSDGVTMTHRSPDVRKTAKTGGNAVLALCIRVYNAKVV